MRKITMSALGKHGRFGNQLFQYAFLKIYAQRYGLEVQIPPWVGQYLFGTDDPPVTVDLPRYQERWPGGAMGKHLPPDADEAVDHDFAGYAQYHMGWYRPHRETICRLFQPVPSVLGRVVPGLAKLRRLGNMVIGVHIRRGDYGRRLYYRAPIEWYLSCLHELWPTLDEPVLFIATQEKGLAGEFSQYDPVLSEDLGIVFGDPPPGYQDLPENVRRQHRSLDFFPDWYYLSQCDVLLAPNSTFSFTAGMVSPTLKRFFRSCVSERRMVELDLWDTTPLEYELAENYKDVPGLCLTHNPPHWYRCPGCEGEYEIDGKQCTRCNGLGSVVSPPDWWLARQAILEGD